MTNYKNVITMRAGLVNLLMAAVVALAIFSAGCVDSGGGSGVVDSHNMITITDSAGREVIVPDNPSRIAISGPGSSRYFAWLGVTDRIVAVDYQDSSLLVRKSEARPYMLANPEIKEHTALGAARGVVDPEKLLSADPDILFISEITVTSVQLAEEITEKTGIPVVIFHSEDYVDGSDEFKESLRLIAGILHVEDRADAVIKYIEDTRSDLESRVSGVPDADKPTVYVGGVAYNGAHGITGTDPNYYPFAILDAENLASGISSKAATGYAEVSKEQILEWDPDIIFIDLYSSMAAGGGAFYELKTDKAYRGLSALKTGQIYAVNPHTSMGTNHDTCMANAYFVGKILYPEQFADIDPEKKADEIYTFMDGAPVYGQLKANLNGLSYQKIEV